MKEQILKPILDKILENYSYSELSAELICSQWELCTKMRYNSFTKGDIRRINKIYKSL